MTFVIAALTLRRLLRGRAVWISVLIAALPIAFVAILRAQSTEPLTDVDDILVFVMLLLAIIPGMFVASSIGEDIEDRTMTYVWSRPVPRWAVLAGKLLALAPLVAVLVAGSWFVAVLLATGSPPSTLSVVALAAGSFTACFVAAAISTLVPKHGMSLTIAYMLFFDIPVGVMPISLAKLSLTYQLRTLSDHPGSPFVSEPIDGAIGLAVLGALWIAVALWRIRRLET